MAGVQESSASKRTEMFVSGVTVLPGVTKVCRRPSDQAGLAKVAKLFGVDIPYPLLPQDINSGFSQRKPAAVETDRVTALLFSRFLGTLFVISRYERNSTAW